MAVFSNLLDSLVGLFAPEACPSCSAALGKGEAGHFCGACVARVAPVPEPWCRLCMEPMSGSSYMSLDGCCRRCAGGRRFTEARSAGAFEGLLRELVSRLKYDGDRSLAEPLGHLLLDAARSWMDVTLYDAIVPVPLHRDRVAERGFNQAFLVTRPLSEELKLPVVVALERTRSTSAQASLEGRARETNVRGAFSVHPRMRTKVARRTILLVDDVLTTGATADACAGALLHAGAARVHVLTVARTA